MKSNQVGLQQTKKFSLGLLHSKLMDQSNSIFDLHLLCHFGEKLKDF